MGKPNKGRKPRKTWHRVSAARKTRTEKWPKVADVPYDGAPKPLPQGNKGWSKNRKVDEA